MLFAMIKCCTQMTDVNVRFCRYLQLLDEEEQTERDFRFIGDLPSKLFIILIFSRGLD